MTVIHYAPEVAATAEAAPVGLPAPDFDLEAANVDDGKRGRVRLSDYSGKWLMLLFYPRDFSFVCPTELTTFSAATADFDRRRCHLLAIGVDPVELHEEWISTPESQGGLGPMQFPMASDPSGAVSRAYGVYVEDLRVAGRGLFIIDPAGVLQYKVIHNLRVGRNTEEALRVLDALRVGGLCPASWTLADGTIDPAFALDPGRVLGHYRIKRKLGEGGFGQVYEAWDLWLQRTLAIKVLRPGRKVDRDRSKFIEDFAREALYENVVTAARMANLLPAREMRRADPATLLDVRIEGPTMPVFDPVRERQAMELDQTHGWNSRQANIRRLGGQPHQVDAERAQDDLAAQPSGGGDAQTGEDD